MVIIEELKHNSFKEVTIPRPSELVRSYGLTKPAGKWSGDEFLNPSESKLDQIDRVNKEAFEH